MAPLGFVGFFAFLHQHTGQWNAYTRTQSEAWGQDIDLLATPKLVADFVRAPLTAGNTSVAVVGAAFAVVALVLLVRARPPMPVLVYTVGVTALTLSSEALGMKGRFILTAFPLLYGIAVVAKREWFGVVVGMAATLLGATTLLAMTSILLTP